jgi:dephospho-CoA kinase
MTYSLGLTGGIGSGKTTVARALEKLGVPIVDADAIVHELQAPGSPVLTELAEEFGPEILDANGALDRAALADIVFVDPEARKRLGLIIHPKVGLEMLRRVNAAREASVPLVVADIPLLLEGKRDGRDTAGVLGLEAVLVVWVSAPVQLARTVARDGCTEEEAQRRIDAQMPIDEKKQLADFVIDNSGSFEQTEQQVRALFEKLTTSVG